MRSFAINEPRSPARTLYATLLCANKIVSNSKFNRYICIHFKLTLAPEHFWEARITWFSTREHFTAVNLSHYSNSKPLNKSEIWYRPTHARTYYTIITHKYIVHSKKRRLFLAHYINCNIKECRWEYKELSQCKPVELYNIILIAILSGCKNLLRLLQIMLINYCLPD